MGHMASVPSLRPRLLMELGRGGMGTVYLAIRRGLSGFTKLTVVKYLHVGLARDPRYLHMFLDEARLSARLQHPNIVATHDVVQDERTYFLEMEYLEGVSFADALPALLATGDEGRDLAVFALAEVLAGLHHAHELCDLEGKPLLCVHRDVSPTNVMVTYRGEVKLLDFGVAKTTESTLETAAGFAKGKLAYMAPEQALGLAVDRRADVFAVGVMLHRIITGDDLWLTDDDSELVRALREGDIPLVPDGAHPVLLRACRRALEWHPDERFESAEAMRLALEGYLEEHAPRAGARSLARRLEEIFGDERRTMRTELERLQKSTDDLPVALDPMLVDSKRFESGRMRGTATTSPTPLSALPRATLPPRGKQRALATILHLRDVSPSARAFVGTLVGGFGRVVPSESVLVVVHGRGSAKEQVVLAARWALLLRARFPGICAAIATSVTDLHVADARPEGTAAQVAARLVARAETFEAVLVDSLSAAFLEGGFVVDRQDDLRLLRGGREQGDVERLVHGREPPLLGRDDELNSVLSLNARVVAEASPAAVWIDGEPGIGKSRLLRAFLQRSANVEGAARAKAIWSAAGDPLGGSAPYRLVRDLLTRALGLDLTQSADDKRRAVMHFGADVRGEFLCELLGVPADGATSPPLRAARLDPRLMHAQLALAFSDLVAAQLRRGPLVIAVDDAQSADAPSLQLLSDQVKSREGALFLVVAASGRRTASMFDAPEQACVDFVLAPLAREVCARLVGVMLPAASLQTANTFAESSAGSPAHLEELVRAYVRGSPPTTVLAMIQARIGPLPDHERRVLCTASILGQNFDLDGVSSMLGDLSLDDVSVALDALVHRELLVERKVMLGRELSFRSALVREAAHALLSEEARAAAHALAADRLSRTADVSPLAIARHWTAAMWPARAMPAFERAAASSLAAGDVAQAEAIVAEAEVCSPKEADGGSFHALRAQIHHFRGKNKEILGSALRALEQLLPGVGRWFDVVGLAAVGAGASGDRQELRRCDDRLRAHGPVDHDARLSQLRAICRVAGELHAVGEGEAAEQLLGYLDDVARDVLSREPGIAAMRAHVKAGRALSSGDNESALGLLVAAAEAFDQVHDLRGSCLERCNASYACSELGLAKRAAELALESIALAERAGILYVAFGARANLALALLRGGRHREAVEQAERVARYTDARGDRYLGGAAHLYRALGLAGLGDYAGAERDVRIALEARDYPSWAAYQLALLARLLLRRSDVAGALAAAAEGAEILARLGGMESGESFVRLAHFEALRAAGQEDEARRALDVARTILETRAAAIRDVSVREAFLAIDEHRATLTGG